MRWRQAPKQSITRAFPRDVHFKCRLLTSRQFLKPTPPPSPSSRLPIHFVMTHVRQPIKNVDNNLSYSIKTMQFDTGIKGMYDDGNYTEFFGVPFEANESPLLSRRFDSRY